jgi:hypothetical protein
MAAYADAWNSYKARRNYALIAIACLIAVSVVALILNGNTRVNLHLGSVISALFVGSGYLLWQWRTWPCPRCGMRFMGGRGDYLVDEIPAWISSKSCASCGLANYDIIANSNSGRST